MAVTIKDVAKKANVSISTVSRVINSSKPVSDDIKKRVYEVVEELGYTPNPVARSLVMKKRKIIGVIVPEVSMSVMGELINAIEDIAKTYNYDIVLCNTYGEVDNEIRYFELLKAKQVGGIIFATNEINDVNAGQLIDADVPIVLFDRDGTDYEISSVSVNQEHSTYQAVEYLIENGHSDIMLIRAGDNQQKFALEQLTGYKKALADGSIAYRDERVLDSSFDVEYVYNRIRILALENNLPTAIFAASDDMAIAAINAMVDTGHKVPEDCAVIGLYDSKIAKMYRPQLTTIAYPIYDMGAIAVRILIKAIESEQYKPQNIVLEHALISRDSCKTKA